VGRYLPLPYNKPQVIARILGGLGNQMFIYATARALALRNDVPLVLDITSGFKWDSVYNRHYLLDKYKIQATILPVEKSMISMSGRMYRWLLRSVNKCLSTTQRFYIKETDPNIFEPQLLSYKVTSPTWLEGYWQDERYFIDARSVLIEEFDLAATPSQETKTLSHDIVEKKCSICLHIRSYREIPGQANRESALPFEYYKKTSNIISQSCHEPHFFIFSDDYEWAQQHLKLDAPVTFVTHNIKKGISASIEDLWLMTQCKHFIIANSTFSWWGAWLSKNNSKIVIAPSTRLHNEKDSFRVSLPVGWIQI
jgi:hypothetical protein